MEESHWLEVGGKSSKNLPASNERRMFYFVLVCGFSYPKRKYGPGPFYHQPCFFYIFPFRFFLASPYGDSNLRNTP